MVVSSCSVTGTSSRHVPSTMKFTLWAGIFFVILEPVPVLTLSLPEHGCSIECSGRNVPCTLTSSFLESGYVKQPFNGSEGVWNETFHFTNVSINLSSDIPSVIQIVNASQGADRTYQQIDLRTLSTKNKPCTLIIAYLPFSLNQFDIRKLKSKSHSFIQEDPCNTNDTKKQCSILTGTTMIMKPKQTSIELSLTRKLSLGGLKIELIGRPCFTSCSDTMPACVSNLTTFSMTNPTNTLLINNLSSAYYCARAIYTAVGIDCCSIFTGTISRHYAQGIPHTPQYYHRSSYFYYTCLCGIIITSLAVCLHLRFRRGRTTMKYIYTNVSPEGKSNELSCLTPISEYDYSSKDICLIYPKKDGSFMSVMGSFRNLLSNYARKVWDPLDKDELENVIANPARWMQKVLAIPDLKIVMVETEDAINWLNSENRTVDIDNEDLYFYVLSLIINQPTLIFNYRRLHVIRFKTIKVVDDRSLSLVPQKRYQMPHQLGLLIMDLIEKINYQVQANESFPALDKFYIKMEEYLKEN